jgi:hypothetical protein
MLPGVMLPTAMTISAASNGGKLLTRQQWCLGDAMLPRHCGRPAAIHCCDRQHCDCRQHPLLVEAIDMRPEAIVNATGSNGPVLPGAEAIASGGPRGGPESPGRAPESRPEDSGRMSPSAGDKEAAEGDLPCGLFIPRARTVRVPWPHPQAAGAACVTCDWGRLRVRLRPRPARVLHRRPERPKRCAVWTPSELTTGRHKPNRLGDTGHHAWRSPSPGLAASAHYLWNPHRG